MKFCLEAPAYWQVILFIYELKIFKRKHARSVKVKLERHIEFARNVDIFFRKGCQKNN